MNYLIKTWGFGSEIKIALHGVYFSLFYPINEFFNFFKIARLHKSVVVRAKRKSDELRVNALRVKSPWVWWRHQFIFFPAEEQNVHVRVLLNQSQRVPRVPEKQPRNLWKHWHHNFHHFRKTRERVLQNQVPFLAPRCAIDRNSPADRLPVNN